MLWTLLGCFCGWLVGAVLIVLLGLLGTGGLVCDCFVLMWNFLRLLCFCLLSNRGVNG